MRKVDANTTMYYHPTWAVSKLGSNISFIFRIDYNKFENHNIIQMACQVAAGNCSRPCQPGISTFELNVATIREPFPLTMGPTEQLAISE